VFFISTFYLFIYLFAIIVKFFVIFLLFGRISHAFNIYLFIIFIYFATGCSDDAEETVRELERAAGLPLAVVMVGVGDADFSPLEMLCASYAAQKKNQPLQIDADQTSNKLAKVRHLFI
jgi:hypothetical protein